MPVTVFEPAIGEVVRSTTWRFAGAPTNTSFLGLAGLGDFYENITVGAVALYLCTAVSSTTITWTQITVP